MTILLINELFYQSTVFILFCKILAHFWLMDLVHLLTSDFSQPLSSSLILVNGVSWILAFSLCVGSFTCHYSLPPSLGWGSHLGPLAYQASVLSLSTSNPSACPSVLGVLVALPLVSSCVFLCVFLQWDLRMPACLWLGCLFRAWNLPRLLPLQPCGLLQIIFCSHITGALHMAHHSPEWPRRELALCLGHGSLLVTHLCFLTF